MELLSPPQTTEKIQETVDRLRTTSLEPSPEVNALFGQLVSLSTTPQYGLHEGLRAEARQLAAEGESKLERYWAKRIIDNPTELQHFPYIENYLDLAAHEYNALRDYAQRTNEQRWAFIGSGPLPLSAIFLEGFHSADTFTYIDADMQANQLGAEVSKALNDTHTRKFVTANAQDLSYKDYDVIIMAALVGADESEKHAILNHIATSCKDTAIVAARSVPDDGRTLLYPRLYTIPVNYRVLIETNPPQGVINNLVVMQKS